MKVSRFRPALFLLLTALLFQTPPVFAKQTTPEFVKADKIFTLFASRIQIMRAVAYDKWMQRTPIEDKKREAAVLNAAQIDAKKLGIQNIEPLILAQIEIAKAEQRRWHARWDKRGMDSGSAPDLAKSRKQLDQLGKQLLPALKNILPALRDAEWRQALNPRFEKKLKSLPKSERELLWRSMLQMKLEPQRRGDAEKNFKDKR